MKTSYYFLYLLFWKTLCSKRDGSFLQRWWFGLSKSIGRFFYRRWAAA